MKFTRTEILERLNAQIDQGSAILGAGCSNGLIAKCAEVGGADLIISYSTGKTRMMGVATTMITKVSNPITLDMVDEIRNVVRNTPLIGGIEANDIYCLDLEESVTRFLDKGYSGVINFPTVGLTENLLGGDEMVERKMNSAMAPSYGQEKWGWEREVEMISLLRSMDVFTMTYTCSLADAEDMARAGADAICIHFGPSNGGLAGYEIDRNANPEKVIPLMLTEGQKTIDAVRAINPKAICLIHGGPFITPDSTSIIYEKTDAQGFVAASAVERIPIEQAVKGVCEGYKSQTIRGK